MKYPLVDNLYDKDVNLEPIRAGFGRGLKKTGEKDEGIVALCADLTESTHMHVFRDAFPERFIQVGIAEQNLVTVASGLARAGKTPFVSSYAAFSPGRNWEQIRTTIALNNQPVNIVGSHAGVSVGPDGATHQMLEDIALMRVLPNMVVIVPGDSVEAEKATLAMAAHDTPCYLRLAREKTPIFSTEASPFEIGKAYVLREGDDVGLVGTGAMTYELLMAAERLAKQGVQARVVHVPTVKPLDEAVIIETAKKTGRLITAEEAQVAGGLGGAVAELVTDRLPVPVLRIGIKDRFGESGAPAELMEHFRLTGETIVEDIQDWLRDTPRYHQG
jgi:transketolase